MAESEREEVALARIDEALQALRELCDIFSKDFTAPSQEDSAKFVDAIEAAIKEGRRLRKQYVVGGGGGSAG
ncbi:MAG: hypothetical protein M0022_08140 [Desulfobacteraceae bacterium]|nr:hypothetical protein [Desulfobacteraceae bacterium]MDA8162851.1 hypothetical protein [Desulfobacteraceae bacterium]